jgi:hypothetical protein
VSDYIHIVKEFVDTHKKWARHIICEGARFHVLYWDFNGCHCSEKNCIINKPKENK